MAEASGVLVVVVAILGLESNGGACYQFFQASPPIAKTSEIVS